MPTDRLTFTTFPGISLPFRSLSACLHLTLPCDVWAWHTSVRVSVSPLCHPRLGSGHSGTRCAQLYHFPRPWVADVKPDMVNAQMLPPYEHHSRCVTLTVCQTPWQSPLQRLMHSNQDQQEASATSPGNQGMPLLPKCVSGSPSRDSGGFSSPKVEASVCCLLTLSRLSPRVFPLQATTVVLV